MLRVEVPLSFPLLRVDTIKRIQKLYTDQNSNAIIVSKNAFSTCETRKIRTNLLFFSVLIAQSPEHTRTRAASKFSAAKANYFYSNA